MNAVQIEAIAKMVAESVAIRADQDRESAEARLTGFLMCGFSKESLKRARLAGLLVFRRLCVVGMFLFIHIELLAKKTRINRAIFVNCKCAFLLALPHKSDLCYP